MKPTYRIPALHFMIVLGLLPACAPAGARPGMPGPAAAATAEVLVEERPADPAVLEEHLEKRRAEGASPEELAELEALVESARAWEQLGGERIRIAPDKADALRAALGDAAALSAARAREVMEKTATRDAISEIVGSEETLEPETAVSPRAKPAFEDRILDAAQKGDDEALDQVLAEIREGEWAPLSTEATWALAKRLGAASRFSEAADRLAAEVAPLQGRPARGRLWLARGQWLLAADRYDEAQKALSQVIEEYDRTAALVREAETLVRKLKERQEGRAREMLARLVEAEAIMRDGSDYVRAYNLARTVENEYRGTELSREAKALGDDIIRRSEQRATLQINSLWNQFELGLPLEAVVRNLEKLAAISPGDYEQALLARAIEEFRDAEIDRKAGELRDRDQRTADRWTSAKLAETEGRYEDALALYRSLVDSPRKEEALKKIGSVVDQMARTQREQAALLFERALAEEDPAARRKALIAVEKTLAALLVRFEAFSDRARVERDLNLVNKELEKVEEAEGEPDAEAPEESMEPPAFNDPPVEESPTENAPAE